MSDMTQFLPGAIKSRQESEITIAGSATSGTATITSVNTAKTLLIKLGERSTETSIANVASTIGLTNATTVTATRGGSTGTVAVRFLVIEYV